MSENISIILENSKLQNKNLKEINDLLGISFEYMIAGIADLKFDGSIDEFNKSYFYYFNYATILVNPFFVAISNGHSRALYDLFGEFYTYSFGPASISLNNLIEKNNKNPNEKLLKFFEIDYSKFNIPKHNCTRSKEGEGNPSEFAILKKEILDTRLTISDQEVLFRDIKIYSDSGSPDPIFEAIDEGIDIIKERSKNNKLSIFDGEKDIILYRAKFIPKFRSAYQENRIEKIDYADFQNAPEKPFPKVREKREFVIA